MDVIDADDSPRIIPVDGDLAAEALARLARNVPADVRIGRPLAATWNEAEQTVLFLTDVGWFWSRPASAERMVPIDRGDIAEVTCWYGGKRPSTRRL